MNHVIRKQVIELSIERGQNLFMVQQKTRDYFYDRILPILELVFDELTTEQQVLSFDKLEINVGDLEWSEDEFMLDERTLFTRLKDQLTRAIKEQNLTDQSMQVRTRLHSVEEQACLNWLFYMEHGSLPWGISKIDTSWLQQVLETLAMDYKLISRISLSIRENPRVLIRIVKEHDESFLVKFAEVLTARSHKALPQMISSWIINRQSKGQPTAGKVECYIWEKLLLGFATGNPAEQILELLKQPGKNQEHETAIPWKNPSLDDDGIFVRHSGLVLLHPFYRFLFSHINLLQDGNFLHRNAQEKAIMLLHFIATGLTVAEEHELVVPKTLCGFPVEESLGYESSGLGEEERTEALVMMQAAIAQWTILKNTSIDGLREGFLQRNGKLFFKDGKTHLTVESSGIDVLLDHLPWNISIIKLPWLNNLIRVEWR